MLPRIWETLGCVSPGRLRRSVASKLRRRAVTGEIGTITRGGLLGHLPAVPDLDLGGPEALVQGGPHNSRNFMPF